MAEIPADELKVLMDITGWDEATLNDEYYMWNLKCADTYLTKDEFILMFSNALDDDSTHVSPTREMLAEVLFDAMDQEERTNINLDFEECMRFKSVMETNDIQKKIDWIFRLYDINGDGKLSKSEANRISSILVQKLINIVF